MQPSGVRRKPVAGSLKRSGSPRSPGGLRGAAKRAKLDPGAWAAAEAVAYDPWVVPEAHAAAAQRAAGDRKEKGRADAGGTGKSDGSGPAGPAVAHWLAGAVRRPRVRLAYAAVRAEDE